MLPGEECFSEVRELLHFTDGGSAEMGQGSAPSRVRANERTWSLLINPVALLDASAAIFLCLSYHLSLFVINPEISVKIRTSCQVCANTRIVLGPCTA